MKMMGLFATCCIATILSDEFKIGYVLAGIRYFLFLVYGIAYIIATFAR